MAWGAATVFPPPGFSGGGYRDTRQGRNGMPKPASSPLSQWALSLEREREKELVGATR